MQSSIISPPDVETRQHALDITHSWIVQAPAGSGKTQLLTQRFLKLLAHAQQEPEEIIAITFTRKAAEEMRHRIIQTLVSAEQVSGTSSELIYWAQAVLKRDKERNWNLLKNPSRLKITTIDSFCISLVQQMPIESGIGGNIRITENAEFFYRTAAEQMFDELDSASKISEAFALILLHLDNQTQRLLELFSSLLANREQWLYDIIPLKSSAERRKNLEENLKLLCESELSKLKFYGQDFFSHYAATLTEWIPHITAIIEYIGGKSPWKSCIYNEKYLSPNFSNYSAEYIEQWRGLSDWLLTKDGTLRKKFTKNQGKIKTKEAPQDLQLQNDEFLFFLEEFLKEVEQHPAWIAALAKIRAIPNPHYSEQQWQLIEALLEVLPCLVSKLNLLFQEYQTTDFIEMNLRALKALGKPDEPTDLALKLDHKIQHILVDEFQDTSVLQYRLLEQLTAGWGEGDGRTLFLVGDPMQGIYRFRKAEVSLFLKIKREGLGLIKTSPLQLEANFRSETLVVQWVNQLFKQLLPKQDELHIGAVAYHDSFAIKENKTAEIQLIATKNKNEYFQAIKLLEAIKHAKKNEPNASQVILVRSKAHAQIFIRLLREHQLSFTASDIEAMHEHPLIQDLLILTRVCWHLSDRTAWFALLRAPWCGLTLRDLHIIHLECKNNTVWSALKNPTLLEKISPNGQKRLSQFLIRFKPLMHLRTKIPTYQWIIRAWFDFSLELFLNQPEEELLFENFLEILKSFEKQNRGGDIHGLLKHLESLSISAIYDNKSNLPSPNEPIHIMTIHKSKGLEFDHVFLPFLHKSSQGDQNPLLLTAEYIDFNQKNRWILAPIKAYGSELLYDFLKKQENLKNEQEIIRLYYVALTRAKSKIYLHADFSKIRINVKLELSFEPGVNPWLKSMLNIKDYQTLWNNALIEYKEPETFNNLTLNKQNFEKIKQYILPEYHSQHFYNNYQEYIKLSKSYRMKFDSFFGTLLHRLLEYQISFSDLNEKALLKEFQLYGFSEEDALNAVPLILKALENMQTDHHAQWILKYAFNGQIEWAVTHTNENAYSAIRMDVSFIDEDGTQWIIDFKTQASFEVHPNDLTEWLKQQRDYHKAQLETYAQAIRNLHSGRIMLGLYFPIIPYFDSWEFENAIHV